MNGEQRAITAVVGFIAFAVSIMFLGGYIMSIRMDTALQETAKACVSAGQQWTHDATTRYVCVNK